MAFGHTKVHGKHGEFAIEAKGLVKRFKSGRNFVEVLKGVDFDARHGDLTMVMGPSGSGKSTLVKLILHQLYPVHGARVEVFGQSPWDVFSLRRRLGFVSPAAQSDLTGEDALEVMDAVVSGFFASRGVWRRETITPAMRDAAAEALHRMGVEHLIGRSMATLSSGEARRVLIARALAHRPDAILLDEPCGGLDPATRRLFLDSLRPLAQGGATLILVTHHIEEILPEIDHLVLLRDAQVLSDGPKSDLLTGPVLSDLFGMPTTVEK
ncbi:MAG TPA: hypothetical protein DCP26_07225, partial [Brevundimonas sp.]|nr:hypothetical protein [Brevundimonas sp.]